MKKHLLLLIFILQMLELCASSDTLKKHYIGIDVNYTSIGQLSNRKSDNNYSMGLGVNYSHKLIKRLYAGAGITINRGKYAFEKSWYGDTSLKVVLPYTNYSIALFSQYILTIKKTHFIPSLGASYIYRRTDNKYILTKLYNNTSSTTTINEADGYSWDAENAFSYFLNTTLRIPMKKIHINVAAQLSILNPEIFIIPGNAPGIGLYFLKRNANYEFMIGITF